MATTNNRDPRLQHSQKRPHSRSPDGSASSIKRHAGPLRTPSSLAVETSSANGQAPKAPMSLTNAFDIPASLAVEEFFNAAINAAERRIELKAAQVERDKADREYHQLQNQFDQYPITKEQKTEARKRAELKVEHVERRISEQLPEQKRVLDALASLLDQRNANTITRGEVHDLKIEVGRVQSSFSRLEPRISTLESSVSDQQRPINTSNVEARLNELEDYSSKSSAFSSDLYERLRALDTRVNDIDTSSLDNMGGRIMKLETAVRNASDATATLHKRVEALEGGPRQPAASTAPGDVHARTQTLEDQMRTSSPALDTAIRSRLDNITKQIKQIEVDIQDDKDLIIEHVDGEVATLREHVEKTIASTKKLLREEVSDELTATKDMIMKEVSNDMAATKAQISNASIIESENAAAINNCIDRLQKLETKEGDNLSDNTRNSLQQTVSGLQERLQNLEKNKVGNATQLSKTTTQSSSVFQPVMPDNDEDQPQSHASGNAMVTEELWREIAMLKGVTTQHAHIINNLTTDDIVRQMVDQMSVMYPDVRNFQAVISFLRAEVQNINSRLVKVCDDASTAVSGISELSQRLPKMQLDFEQEASRIQTIVSNLMQRAEKHDAALEEGKEHLQKLEQLEAEVKIISEGAMTVKEKFLVIQNLQDQVLNPQEDVRGQSA